MAEQAKGPVIKAHVVGGDRAESLSQALLNEDSEAKLHGQYGALQPKLDKKALCRIAENSNNLPQVIRAYETNIDGLGHRLERVIDPEDDGVKEEVRDALIDAGIDSPTDEQVQAKLDEVVGTMRRERLRARRFFEFASVEESFISLRRRTRVDLEITGEAFWEIVRNNLGEIVGVNFADSCSMRLMPRDKHPTEWTDQVPLTALTWETRKVPRRFRRFVQIVNEKARFFKEFGDPRTVSAKTGRYYRNRQELRNKEGKKALVATELIHFKIYAPGESYGVPRWVGALPAVLGSRSAEEVNLAFFENKSIPPLMILVSGGTLNEDAASKIEEVIETEVKGKGNFHKVLILEATSEAAEFGEAQGSGQIRIEVKPLNQFIQDDALFQQYDERNMDKIGMIMRVPRLLRGDTRDMNRATARASLEFAEQQVFQPERVEFDWFINRRVLPALGVHYWRFKSLGPLKRDADTVGKLVLQSHKEGAIVPSETRELLGEVFGQELKRIDAPWTKQPMPLSRAGAGPAASTGGQAGQGAQPQDELDEIAREVLEELG